MCLIHGKNANKSHDTACLFITGVCLLYVGKLKQNMVPLPLDFDSFSHLPDFLVITVLGLPLVFKGTVAREKLFN